VTNRSAYLGWHDWHTDGPSHYGRYHKVFIMVWKNETTGADAATTNVRLAHARALADHACQREDYEDLASDPDVVAQHRFRGKWDVEDQARGGDLARDRSQLNQERMRAWGIRHDWHGFEHLGCDIAMDPGDVLFFREDVWHRTQDMLQARV